MDISNKTLALVLVAAIAVSLVGMLASVSRLNSLQNMAITGFATSSDSGIATLTVNATARLIFSDDTIDWDSGWVNTTGGNQNCHLTTDGYNDANTKCAKFNTQADGLTLKNDGNVVFSSVNLNISKNAADLLSGTDSSFQFRLVEELGAACLGGLVPTTMKEVNSTFKSADGGVICSSPGFNFSDEADDIYIDVNLTVPYDSLKGTRTASFVAIGTY